jgi:hypothetical protein
MSKLTEAMEAFALRALNDGTAEELAILPDIIRLYLDCTKNEKQSNSIAVISDSIKHKKF